jgi:DNA-binding MarR family transcriptional regulator
MALPQLYTGTSMELLLLKCHKLEKEVARSSGFTVDEFHCIIQLYLHAPCCVKALCELLEVHPSRASRLIKDLEKRRYLTRSLGYSDKRKELLVLTAEGVRVAENLLQSSTLSISRFLNTLPKETRSLLATAPEEANEV